MCVCVFVVVVLGFIALFLNLLVLLLLSVVLPVANAPDIQQPCVLPLMFKLSPPVVSSRVLAVRGGAKPYYF